MKEKIIQELGRVKLHNNKKAVNKNPVDWLYFGLAIVQILFVTIIATMMFLVQPIYWRVFVYNRPDFITAVVFEFLLLGISAVQLWYLKKTDKFNYSTVILSFLALFVLFLNVLGFVLVPIMMATLAKQKSKKRIYMNTSITIATGILAVPLFLFSTLLFWGLATTQPENETTSFSIRKGHVTDLSKAAVPIGAELNALTWNLGYASTGSDTGYFYDLDYDGNPGVDGKAHSKKVVEHHLKGIKQFLAAATSEDSTKRHIKSPIDIYHVNGSNKVIIDKPIPKVNFGFLQEVDRDSLRSFQINQAKEISNILGNDTDSNKGSYDSEFVNNHRVGQMPVPFMDPGGQVSAGLLSFSNYKMLNDAKHKPQRISLHSVTPGVNGIFNLKRAIGLTEYKVANGKTFHMANVHMSAFPYDKAKRTHEYNTLVKMIKKWIADGDYMIIGADWNTDITDSYFYEKAEKDAANSKANSQKLKDENLFNLKGKTGPTATVQELGVYDISKFPDNFRKSVKDNNLNLGVDYNIDNPTMHSNSQILKSVGRDGHYVPSFAIIDGFLTSSNVEIIKTQTYQQGWNPSPYVKEQPNAFADTDHNPVVMTFKFK